MENRKLRAGFKDVELDARFEREGYILIRDWVSKDQVSSMRKVFAECYKDPESPTNLYNSLTITEQEVRKNINNTLMKHLKPLFEKHFYDMETTFCYFLTKPVTEEHREVPLHSDSSAVNEEKFDYLTVWLPLVDVSKENGCIYLIPGSHKLFTYTQPFAINWPYSHLKKCLTKYMLDLPMKAGDVLLFSSKTIHGSYNNQSQNPRPVVGSGLLYPGTEMRFNYFNQDKNLVNSYEVEPSFYFGCEFGEPKEGTFPLVHSFLFNPPEMTSEMIKQFFTENPVKNNGRFSFLRRLGLYL